MAEDFHSIIRQYQEVCAQLLIITLFIVLHILEIYELQFKIHFCFASDDMILFLFVSLANKYALL